MSAVLIYPRKSEASTTEARMAMLQQMETKTGTAIPKDYRTFMIEHGGGFPWPSDMRVENEQVKALIGHDVNSIFEFFTVDNVAEHLNEDIFWGGTPQGYLIIGDAYGLLLLLSLQSDSYGNVFLWRPKTTPWGDADNNASHLAPLSPSFVGVIDAMTDLSREGPGKQVWENGGRRSEAREIVV